MTFALVLTDDPALVMLGDIARSLCAVGAAVLIGLALALALRTTRRVEHARSVPLTYDQDTARDFALLLLGFALLAVSALFTELGKIGDPVTWRLPFNVAGIAVGLVAVRRLLRRVREAGRA